MELIRSPNSATIRTGNVTRAETHIKNAVDFVVLDSQYQREQSLQTLAISGYATSEGRRTSKVETRVGNKVNYTSVYIGYKLADLLLAYIQSSSAKAPEGEPFFRLILEMLRRIAYGK